MISPSVNIKGSRPRPNWHYPAFIAVVNIALYWQVCHFDFLIGWDDQWFVTNHYTSDGLTISNLTHILTDFFRGQYAPVNQLYYTFIYSLCGYSPFFYHFGGSAIHLINSLLVFYLAEKIVEKISLGDYLNNSVIALFTALLFTAAPINLEPTAWVAASKVLLYSLFYLLSLLFYINYILTGKTVKFYLTLTFFVLSFGAKEQAVTLPVCLLFLDWFYGRPLKSLAIWLEKLPFFLLSILFGIISIKSQDIDVSEIATFYPFYQRILLAFYTFSEYITKCILPVNLSYIYPFPFKNGESMPFWLWLYPLCILTGVYSLARILRKPWVLFGMVFFCIHIALVINLVSLARHSIVADRYAYVSSIGIFFMLSYQMVYWAKGRGGINSLKTIAIIYFFCFYCYSYQHLAVWRNVKTLKAGISEIIETRKDYEQWEINSKKNGR